MLKRTKYKSVENYKTFTTEVTINEVDYKSNDSFFDEETVLEVEFQTKEGIVFSQQLEISYQEDTLLERIIECVSLQKEDSELELKLVGNTFKAVVASKDNLEKNTFVVVPYCIKGAE